MFIFKIFCYLTKQSPYVVVIFALITYKVAKNNFMDFGQNLVYGLQGLFCKLMALVGVILSKIIQAINTIIHEVLGNYKLKSVKVLQKSLLVTKNYEKFLLVITSNDFLLFFINFKSP